MLSVNISEFPAQSLSTQPGILSGLGALRALILWKDLLTLSGKSIIIWVPGRDCCVVVMMLNNLINGYLKAIIKSFILFLFVPPHKKKKKKAATAYEQNF